MNKKGVFLSLGSMLIVAVLFVTLAGTPTDFSTVEIAQVIDLQNTEEIIVQDSLALILREEVIESINEEAEFGSYYTTSDIADTENELSINVKDDIIGPPADNQINLRSLNLRAQDLANALVAEDIVESANFFFSNLQITQSGTWQLNVQATIDYTLYKESLETTLTRTGQTISTSIPINRLLDPLMTRRLGTNVIVTPYTAPNDWQANDIRAQADALGYLPDIYGLTYMERWMQNPRTYAQRVADHDSGIISPGIFTLEVTSLGLWSVDYMEAETPTFDPTPGTGDCYYKVDGHEIYIPHREYVIDLDQFNAGDPTHPFYQASDVITRYNPTAC